MKQDMIQKYNYKKLLEQVDMNDFFSNICYLSDPYIIKKVEYSDSKSLKLLIKIREKDALADMTIVAKNYDADGEDFSDFSENEINYLLLEIDEYFPALNPKYIANNICVEYNKCNKCDNFIVNFSLDMPTTSIMCSINFLFKGGNEK